MQDPRYNAAILTIPQTSALTGLPTTTLRNWIKQDAIHNVPNKRGWPIIALAGLIEAHLGEQLIDQGYSPRRARQIIQSLDDNGTVEYLDQIPKLVADQVDVFLHDEDDLLRLKDGQGAFLEILEPYLHPIVTLEGKVKAFDPPRADFTRIDPGINGGVLSLKRSRVPVFAILGSLEAGSSPAVVAEEYEVDAHEVERIDADREWFAQAA